VGKSLTPKPEGPYLSPREVAYKLGISPDMVYYFIEEGRIATLKIYHGRRIYHWIPEEEVKRLKELPQPKEKMLTTKQVADMLGVDICYVSELARTGKIKAIRIGYYYKIPESEVTRLKKERGMNSERKNETETDA